MAAGRRVALGATGRATGDAGWSAAGERRHRRSDLEGELWAVMGGFGPYGAVWRPVRWWSAGQRTVRYRRLPPYRDRKSTRLNSSHGYISYAVFCLKKKKRLTILALVWFLN